MFLYKKTTDLLLKAGLSETEAIIYNELLKKPADTVYDLVRRTGISKSSAYRAVDSLKNRGIISGKNKTIAAKSLKNVITSLNNSRRKLGKIAEQLQKISPFLHLPNEAMEEFEYFYGAENVAEQYLAMSQRNYSVNFDFGDFENFIDKIGGLEIGNKFRNYRFRHASHFAICTTFGPNSAYYATKEAEKEFKNKLKVLNIDFKNKFIIFSDTDQTVLFINSENEKSVSAVLVKSKLVADIERARFDAFSQKVGKF